MSYRWNVCIKIESTCFITSFNHLIIYNLISSTSLLDMFYALYTIK